MSQKKLHQYLGDSVYAEEIECMGEPSMRLYLDNGVRQHNEIILEPNIIVHLKNFIRLLEEKHGGGE